MTGERSNFPEFVVQRGDIVRGSTEEGEAVGDYRQAADQARTLGLRHIELMAMNRLVAILQDGGRITSELERLAEVYDGIVGGSGEPEMIWARMLLGR